MRLTFCAIPAFAALSIAMLPGACSAEPPAPIQVEDAESMDEEYMEDIIGSINPLENDLRGLEVAVRMRDGFRIKADGAIFNLGVTDGSGEVRLDEEFILTETKDIESETLTGAASGGFYVRTYKLSKADYPRMHAGDLVLQQLKRDNPGENKLNFSATTRTCAEPEMTTPDVFKFAIFARTSSDVDFVALSGDVSIPKETAGPFQIAWEPCEDPS